ncbi:transposase [Hymenobacter sp. APR13]|uniref:transposase n=1 Tax=Hymenobacter sp. APR13 TaxID=1356852 RepID=UPI0009DD32B8|nr:transposase [Hymenobacter sp. APR13]
MAHICREHGIGEPTFYQWKRKYGCLEVTGLQRLKHLEEENRRLKQLLADLSLENQVVKEVLRKK